MPQTDLACRLARLRAEAGAGPSSPTPAKLSDEREAGGARASGAQALRTSSNATELAGDGASSQATLKVRVPEIGKLQSPAMGDEVRRWLLRHLRGVPEPPRSSRRLSHTAISPPGKSPQRLLGVGLGAGQSPWFDLQYFQLPVDSNAWSAGATAIADGVLLLDRRFTPQAQSEARQAWAGHHPADASQHAKAWFFDTETTGLNGAGSRAFLIGAAQWQGPELRMRQWLLTRPRAEAALLRSFAAAVPDDALIVSFNGASFDAPLLRARARLHGLADPLAGRQHIDLLHRARRAFGTQIENCRLATLECRLLGIERVADLPSAQVPATWRAWLAEPRDSHLTPTLNHHRQDLASLAALLLALHRYQRGVPAAAGVGRRLSMARPHRPGCRTGTA